MSFAEYQFGADRILSRDGIRLRLKYQSAQLLSLLLDRAGQIVTREEIRNALWDADTFVDFDQGINNCIREIRSVLHDEAENPRYIETVAKLGYRFLVPVNRKASAVVEPELHAVPAAPIPFPASPGSREAANSPAARPSSRVFNLRGWLPAAVILVVLGIGAWASMRWLHPPAPAKAGPVTIAVLPFTGSAADSSSQYLSEGITESVIDDLSRFGASSITVIARTSSNNFAGWDKPVQEIGRKLNANYIVRGKIESLGDHFKLTAELLRTQDGDLLWTYESEWTTNNVMGADGAIARGIMRKLALTLPANAEESPSEFSRMNPKAYRFYLLGRHDLNQRSRESLLRATQEFKSAIEEEPDSGPAYAGLADADNLLAFYGGSPFYKSVLEAEQQARHAIQIDDSLAEAHAALGYSEFMWGWQWAQAEAEFRKALALNPNYAAAHHWYALYLAAMGRFPEAETQIAAAEQLDPLSAIRYAGGAYVDYMARNYDGALQESHLALALNPKLMAAYAVLGWSYAASGKPDDAISSFHTADQLAGGSTVYGAGMARAYALAGQPDAAEKILTRMDRLGEDSMTASLRAQVLASLGKRDDAIALLYKGYEGNDPSAVWLKVDPQYDSLRPDPKFQALLHRMDFPK